MVVLRGRWAAIAVVVFCSAGQERPLQPHWLLIRPCVYVCVCVCCGVFAWRHAPPSPSSLHRLTLNALPLPIPPRSLFYYLWVPKAVHSFPVFLDYRSHCPSTIQPLSDDGVSRLFSRNQGLLTDGLLSLSLSLSMSLSMSLSLPPLSLTLPLDKTRL